MNGKGYERSRSLFNVLQITAVWYVALCHLVQCRAFRRNIPSPSAGYFCTRKVTATGSFDTLVKLYHITRRRIPGDSRHCFENLLSYNLGDYLKRCIAQTVYRVCTRIHYRVVSVTKLNKYLHCGTSGTE